MYLVLWTRGMKKSYKRVQYWNQKKWRRERKVNNEEKTKGQMTEYKTKQNKKPKIEDWRLSQNAHDGLILSKLPIGS